MKYVFIVNPVSGKGGHDQTLELAINELISGNPNRDIRYYRTGGRGDAAVLAEAIASEAREDTAIFACGGDGTAHEIAAGIRGHEHGILGVVPEGRHNDFFRSLTKTKNNAADYLDLTRIFNGMVKRVDLIRMSWIENGSEKSGYIINGINIGLEGDAGILAKKLGKLPAVPDKGSQLLAGAAKLAAGKMQKLRITADGRDFHTGELLLVTAANGGYHGGAESCPGADMTDGLIELLAVRDISRREFLTMLPKYRSGRITDIKGAEDTIIHTRARNVIIEPMLGPTMRFTADGEMFETGALRIDIVPKALRVLVI